ncbi:MAG: DUF1566 domain-containing protein [Desulfobacteraceae bacterium]|nr:DUF1566 domain-containing protein [Desulfobacteraceae bacterium]
MLKRILFCLLFLISYSTFAFSWPVPDTGQKKCYDDLGNQITCPKPGEPFYGQDANYSINPISYTKLDANGNDLPDSAWKWAMVRDNVTGLIWEVKTGHGSVHSRYESYTWKEAQDIFIKKLNGEKFGGYSDWRIPNNWEIASIGHYENDDDYWAVSSKYFPWLRDRSWSSTPSTPAEGSSESSYAWVAEAHCRKVSTWTKTTDLGARAVRGDQSFGPSGNLTINGDNTVTDKNTGLMWQQIVPDYGMTWKDALEYCENLSLAGYNDWRMPTTKELGSIVDYNRIGSAIDTDYFPTPCVGWSSTTCGKSESYAGDNNKSNTSCIRAVRGGQSGIAQALTKKQVSQLYVSIFGRASEGEGNAYWGSSQGDMLTCANAMLATSAAKDYFGDTLNDNQAFIEFIYENTLGKTYAQDPDGIDYWVSELAGGKPKGAVVTTLINAVMDVQYTGTPSQKCFINKVTVSNYAADKIHKFTDFMTFTDFIRDINSEEDSVVIGKDKVDEVVR